MSDQKLKRSCDGCTACCEGHLHGEAYGHPFYKGRPCYFKGTNGCTIYDNRPEKQCANYHCAWIRNINGIIPEWMKPNECGVIISEKSWKENNIYWEVTECDGDIKSNILIWLMLYQVNNNQPMSVQVHGSWYHFGSQEFLTSRKNL